MFVGVSTFIWKSFFVGQWIVPSLCSKRMHNSHFFVKGRYEKACTYQEAQSDLFLEYRSAEMPVLSCNARSLPLEAFSGSFCTLRNSSRMFTCHEGIDISFYMAVQFKTLLSMLSTILQSGANGQVNASVERCWPFPPALTTSEIHQNRFEE